MLHDEFRRFKTGYHISSSLLGIVTEEKNASFWDQQLGVQRSDALPNDPFMALGYLAGATHSFIKHPYKTLSIWRSGKESDL